MKILDIYTISSAERDKILIEHFKHKEIRETNPAVALAWQHYNTLVKLAHHGKEPKPMDETQFG